MYCLKCLSRIFGRKQRKPAVLINKTAGSREAGMFLQSVYEIETVGSRILTKYIPPLKMGIKISLLR